MKAIRELKIEDVFKHQDKRYFTINNDSMYKHRLSDGEVYYQGFVPGSTLIGTKVNLEAITKGNVYIIESEAGLQCITIEIVINGFLNHRYINDK